MPAAKKKSPAKKAAAKKVTDSNKKIPAKKPPAKKSPSKKTTVAKKPAAKKPVAKKTVDEKVLCLTPAQQFPSPHPALAISGARRNEGHSSRQKFWLGTKKMALPFPRDDGDHVADRLTLLVVQAAPAKKTIAKKSPAKKVATKKTTPKKAKK